MVVRLLPLLLLSGSLAAQLAGIAGVDVSDNSQIDYARPTVSVLAGAEYVAPRWEVSLIGDASRARKQELASGQSYGACMTALARPWGMLLVGVCLGYQYTQSPIWSKDAMRPCVLAGLELGRGRILVGHSFAGTDSINGSQDQTVSFRYSIGRTRLGVHISRLQFHASNYAEPRYTRGTWGVSVTETF